LNACKIDVINPNKQSAKCRIFGPYASINKYRSKRVRSIFGQSPRKPYKICQWCHSSPLRT